VSAAASGGVSTSELYFFSQRDLEHWIPRV